jgi:Uma2 family endonuclease
MLLDRGANVSTVSDRPLQTLADLLERLGHVPQERIRFHPAPGTATEQVVLDIRKSIDGVLVEKAMGYEESILAVYLCRMIGNFVQPQNLGHVTGEAGMMRLFPGLVRIPDVAFASWGRFPHPRLTGAPIPHLVPDLAVEALSPSKTAAEMSTKLDEYFAAGIRLVWIVDPRAHTVTVHESADRGITLQDADTLDGGAVVAWFQAVCTGPVRRTGPGTAEHHPHPSTDKNLSKYGCITGSA